MNSATLPPAAPVDTAPAATAPLYLAQLHVSYEQAARLLRIRDAYDWHQHLWQAFPGRDGARRDFLVRIDQKEEAYRILLLSHTTPVRPDWCPGDAFAAKPIPEKFFSHPAYTFSLLANPTKKVRSNAAGERTKNGRRVPLGSRDELIAWLERKGQAAGFTFDSDATQTVPRGREFFHKEKGNTHGTHTAVEFRGRLHVTNPAAFRHAVATGIGSAKAFGFGLLVLAPLA
jgi:CRISPR system Cascade subunit CasE